MRLEVLLGSDDPKFYQLSSIKTLVGSDPSCDIIIVDKEVSRKHIVIYCEDENYFVADQGSSNGSFLNEERLVPGRKVEFNSFFPVRLGKSILLSLISDEESADEEILIPIPGEKPAAPASLSNSDKTVAISLKDLYNTKTETLVKKRQEVISKRTVTKAGAKKVGPKKVVKKKSSLQPVHYVVIMILGLGGYFTYLSNRPDEVVEIANVEAVPKQAPVTVVKLPDPLSEAEYKSLLSSEKCQTPPEIYFCNGLYDKPESSYGTIIKDNKVYMLIDATKLYAKAQAIFTPPPPEVTETQNDQETTETPSASLNDLALDESQTSTEQEPSKVATRPVSKTAHMTPFQRVEYEQVLGKITVGLFILEGVTSKLDLEKIPAGTVLHLGLIRQVDGKPELLAGVTLTEKGLRVAKILITYQKLSPDIKTGKPMLDFTKELYTVIHGNYVPE